MFLENVHTEYASRYFNNIEKIVDILSLIPNREFDLGQYIFTKAEKIHDVDCVMAPDWLYRSLFEK